MKSNSQEIPPRWLRLIPASKYSAIGKQRLIALANDGLVIGFKDPDDKRGSWIFDRYSLDEYRESQAGNCQLARRKALDILEKINSC